MPDIIITPSTGKLEFIDNSAQVTRRHSFTLDQNDGLLLDAPLSAAAVSAPLNIINVTVNNSNVNYPFVLAQSGETGAKNLLMDGAGGTYNPFTNTATIDISGNSATTTLASNSTNLGGVDAASYVTLTGTQTLTNKTITGTFTGNLTGTGSWATNAVSAVSATTATNSTQLNGQAASYYTNIPARLGYTPVNQAGDTIAGNLTVNGNFTVNGSVTAFSASNIYLSSSVLTVEDNILTLNAFSPYLRYAGIEMYDSGSGTLSQLLWDGDGDYFFLTGSSVNGKIITGPDGQTNLSSNYIPKATAGYKLGNSLIYDSGTNIGIGITTPVYKTEIYSGVKTSAFTGLSISNFNNYDGTANSLVKSQLRFAILENPISTYDASQRTFAILESGNEANNSSSDGFFAISTRLNGAVAEKFRITSTGYVGIGATSPTYKLQVNGGATEVVGQVVASFEKQSSTDGKIATFVNTTGSGYTSYIYIGSNPGRDWKIGKNVLNVGTTGHFQITNDLNQLRMQISAADDTITFPSSSVGIGTSSPAYKLDVGVAGSDVISVRLTPGYERVRFNTFDLLGYNDGNLWMIGNNPTNTLVLGKTWDWDNQIGIAYTPGTVGNSGGILQIGQISKNNANYTHGITRLYTNGLERITIIANGNVGIGTTLPTTPLHVVGVISGSSFSGAGTGLTGTAASLTAGTATIANGVATGAVKSGGLEENSVITSKIADGNVTNVKLASSSVTIGSSAVSLGSTLTTIAGLTSVTSTTFVGALTGNASTATNSTQLGGVAAASYVTLTGTETLTNKTITGTFTGALTGNASTATSATVVTGTNGQLLTKDVRTIAPNNIANGYFQFGFTSWTNNNNSPYADYLHLRSYTDSSGGNDNLVMFRKDAIGMRIWQQTFGSATNYSSYKDVCWTDGTNASGNWTITSSWATNAVTALNVGNGTITIAAGTGVGVGSTNTFTTNQSGATTVTISNSGVTSNVAGTGISLSGGTGAVTITNSGVTSAVAGTGVGVSAATGAVTFSIGQAVGPANTPSFAGIISSAVTNYAYLQVVDTNNFWITPGNANWGLYFETSAGGLLGGTGDSNRLGFVGAGTARFYVDLNNGNGWFGGALTAAGNISAANLSGTNTGDQTIGNGTITIAAGTGVGVGSSNTFTTNQSGATTVTITNTGVTSVAGTSNQVSVSAGTGTVTFSLPQNIHTAATPTFASVTTSADGANITMAGTTNAEGIRMTPASSTTYPVFLRSVNPGVGEASPWIYKEQATDWGIWHNNPVNSIDFTKQGSGGIASNVGGSSSNTVTVRVEMATGYVQTIAGYRNSAGTTILDNTGNITGNAATATTATNANAISFTEVELNAPATTSGTWTTGNGSQWGEPKFGTSFNQFRYADGDGPYVEYNVPANHHACFISQLQWDTGGYADCHGVQSDGDLVFLRRINTRQLVENSDHGNTIQHDGATVSFVGSGLGSFTKIRITNRGGRIHMTGIAFTRQIDDGYEGTGMVHPAQISHQGSGSGLNADLLDGYNPATANTTNTIVLRDTSGNFSAGTITATLSGNATTATTATTANALNTGNSYTGVNFTATGYFQTTTGFLRTDDANGIEILTTTNSAQTINVKGILIGSSYDTNPPQNEIRTSNNQSLVLNARGSGQVDIYTNDSTKVTVLNGGNVGVGTSNPGRKLDVEGIVRTRGASGSGGFEIGAATTGTAKWRIEWDSASDSLDFNWVG